MERLSPVAVLTWAQVGVRFAGNWALLALVGPRTCRESSRATRIVATFRDPSVLVGPSATNFMTAEMRKM